MNKRRQRWEWCEHPVSRSGDHFELRFGSAEKNGWDDWVPVALVGPAQHNAFAVQFLVDRDDPSQADIVKDLIHELDFYLVELSEPDPWKYAQYHCGTASNVYSSIHWSFFPEGWNWEAGDRQERRSKI